MILQLKMIKFKANIFKRFNNFQNLSKVILSHSKNIQETIADGHKIIKHAEVLNIDSRGYVCFLSWVNVLNFDDM